MTKKKFLEELKKKFCNVGNVVRESIDFPSGTQEYYVIVQDTKDTLFAEYPLHFLVEKEDTFNERAFTPHPNKKKQERFKEELKKKVESFRLS